MAYYARNRDAEIERVTRRQQATLAWLRELRSVLCMDCGGTFPPYVMDFDHRDPKTKPFSLAAGKSLLKNRAVLEAEVAKCDIVCANCHRIRTHTAFMNGTMHPIALTQRAEGGTPEQIRSARSSDASERPRQRSYERCEKVPVPIADEPFHGS